MQMTRLWTMWLGLALAAGPAAAQPAATRPWAEGVPTERQALALARFRDGNAALRESLFVRAATAYREALQAWEHPAIHHNLALALASLDQPVEAHAHLEAALRFGPAPLDDDTFQQAQRGRALIERQLTRVRVTCDFPDAAVRLDGRPLFTGPGRWDGWVRAGPHAVTASREGFLSDERAVTLAGGETRTFELRLSKTEELTEYRRAFSPIVPWTAVGAGLAAVGAGVGLHLAARQGFADYDARIVACAQEAGGSTGCLVPTATQDVRAAAATRQAGAVALYAVGGAALAASAVLFYVGRPVASRKTVTVEATAWRVLPALAPSGFGAVAALAF